MTQRRVRRIAMLAAAAAAMASIGVTLAASQAQGRSDEEARFQLRADIAAHFVNTYVSQLLASESAVGRTQLSGARVQHPIFDAVASAYGFVAAVVLDHSGDAIDLVPYNRAVIGRHLSGQYRHLAEAIGGHPAVSNLVMSASRHIPVIGFAAPYETPYGLRVLSGAYSVDRTPIQEYLSNAIPMTGHHAYLIDAAGDVVASNPAADPAHIVRLQSVDASLARAAAGSVQGTVDSSYYVTRPVAGTPWRLIVSTPLSSLYMPVSGAVFWVPWLLFGVLIVGVSIGFLYFFRYMDSRQRLSELNAQLTRLSRVDDLTGLHNRRHLEEQMDMLLSAARRHRSPLSVLLLDIDHFKAVNDEHGHASGDAVLRETSSRLRACMRTEDVIGRWGGEEFLVLLPETSAAAARVLAERLRACVSASPITVDRTIPLQMTISIGVSSGWDESASTLLHRADAALYGAKRGGRDCVVVSAPSAPLGARASAPAAAKRQPEVSSVR